jgi:hypothetical protein
LRIKYVFSLQLLLFPVFLSDILDDNNLEVFTFAQAERVSGVPPIEKSSPKPPEQLDLEAQLNALSGETPTDQKPPAFGSANSKTSASSATNSNKAGVATKLFASGNNTSSNSNKLPASSTSGKPPSTTIPTVSSAKPYAVNNKSLTAVNTSGKTVPNSTSIPTPGSNSSNGPAGGASIASKQTAGAQSLAASMPLLNAGSSPSSSKTPTAVAAAAAQQQQRIGTAGPAARKKGEERVFLFVLFGFKISEATHLYIYFKRVAEWRKCKGKKLVSKKL